MKKIILSSSALLVLSVIIYVLYSSWQYKQTGTVTTSDSFYLTDKQVEQFKKTALQGDEGASYDLTYYYDIYRQDSKEADKWFMFAVNHDHVWALETYGHRLCHDKKIQEGLIYLNKACKAGAKDACAKIVTCKSNKH